MKTHSSKKNQSKWRKWESIGWWSNMSLSDFSSLFSFANKTLSKDNWKDALWDSMGREKSCWVTKLTEKGVKRVMMWLADAASEEGDIEPYIPKIFDQEANFELAKDLQLKIRKILDNMTSLTALAERQRISDSCDMPWEFTHYKEFGEVLTLIKSELNISDTRTAVILDSGFQFYEDSGKNASQELGWQLIALANVISGYEAEVIKKCLWCEKFFVHETGHKKKYCCDNCRYDHHNKSSISNI